MSKETSLRLDNQLCFALYSSSRLVGRLYRPLLEKLKITYPQYLVLLVLWEEDGLAVNELGRRLFLDSGTLTPLLKRLEKGDILERRRFSDDERRVLVFLTKAGRMLKEQALEIPEQILCQSGQSLVFVNDLKGRLDELISHLTNKQA